MSTPNKDKPIKEASKKSEDQKKPVSNPELDNEKEQKGILPEDVDFRRGLGCG